MVFGRLTSFSSPPYVMSERSSAVGSAAGVFALVLSTIIYFRPSLGADVLIEDRCECGIRVEGGVGPQAKIVGGAEVTPL
jgi:hypothetical protein